MIIFDQAVIVKSNDFQNDTPKIQYSSAILRGLRPAGKQTNNALVSAIESVEEKEACVPDIDANKIGHLCQCL